MDPCICTNQPINNKFIWVLSRFVAKFTIMVNNSFGWPLIGIEIIRNEAI